LAAYCLSSGLPGEKADTRPMPGLALEELFGTHDLKIPSDSSSAVRGYQEQAPCPRAHSTYGPQVQESKRPMRTNRGLARALKSHFGLRATLEDNAVKSGLPA